MVNRTAGALVSIVIPVYNVEKYLSECLESVTGQSYQNIEVICVDDASTDHSFNILEEYSRRDKRVRIIKNEKNRGQAFARNAGLAQVRGKYTYFLDSDDCIELYAIERLVNDAEAYGTECIFFNSRLLVDTKMVGRGAGLNFDLKELDREPCDGPALFKIMIRKKVYSNSLWRRFWNTEFLIDNHLKFADELRTSEDELFSIPAILFGKRMMVVDETYHRYRRREGSLTTESGLVKMVSAFKCYCRLVDFWRNHQFDEDINEIMNQVLHGRLITVRRLYIRNRGKNYKGLFAAGVERHLFEAVIVQEYEKTLNYVDKSVLSEIEQYPKVIVFGAYIYAAEVVERLERNGVTVTSLAVTHMHEKAEGMHGIPVNEIKDLCAMKDEAIVVLGVGKGNREDVIDTLKEYGFFHYVSLD